MFDLTGKTALVTGATGGIGGAIAQALHAQLYLAARGELDRVGQHIAHHLLEARRVDHGHQRLAAQRAGQLDAAALQQRLQLGGDLVHEGAQVVALQI